jgi:hypothetical protein
MPIPKDEKERLRKELQRSLFFIGIGALGLILALYIGTGQQSQPKMLADIASNFQQESPVTASPDIEKTAPTSTTTFTSAPAPTSSNALTVSDAADGDSVGDGMPAPATIAPNDGQTTDDIATTPMPAPEADTTVINAEPSSTPGIAPVPTSEFRDFPGVVSSTVKSLPYTISSFQSGDGWQGWWGDVAEASGTLIISADTSTTGGGALLAGSSVWSDYSFQATLDWLNGESFGLLARYTSRSDYLACEFDDTSPTTARMYLDRYVGGKGTTLAGGDIVAYQRSNRSNIVASISVKGTQATCSFNSQTISGDANGMLTGVPTSGGIGFTTWDPNISSGEIIVKSVSVH